MGKLARRAAEEREVLKSLTVTIETTGLERFLALKFANDLPTQGEEDARKRSDIIDQFEGTDWRQDEWAGKAYPEELWSEPQNVTLTRMAARNARAFLGQALMGCAGRQARELLRLADRIDDALKTKPATEEGAA